MIDERILEEYAKCSAKAYNTSQENMLHSKSRDVYSVFGRQALTVWLHEQHGFSHSEIGRILHIDHGTSINRLKQHNDLCEHDQHYRQRFRRFCRMAARARQQAEKLGIEC